MSNCQDGKTGAPFVVTHPCDTSEGRLPPPCVPDGVEPSHVPLTPVALQIAKGAIHL
jgi:hypothetical protein